MNQLAVKIIYATFMLIVCITPFVTLPGAPPKGKDYILYPHTFKVQDLTIYNPVSTQCDRDPLVTASNHRIDTTRLRSGSLRWIALSRELLKRWGGAIQFGDTVIVDAKDDTIDGTWVVQDTMHKRFISHGDLLFAKEMRSTGKWNNVTLTRYEKLFLARQMQY